MPPFVHLHNHSEYSILDGLTKIKDYPVRAKEMGFTSLALTDHGNIDGALKFQSACKGGDIRPIFGTEFYMVPNISIKEKGESRYHITALVKNETGWKNLLNLITISNVDGFYYRPRISPKYLLEKAEGLIFLSACSSTFLFSEWGDDFFNELNQRTECYYEIMPHNFEEQIKLNSLVIDLSEKTKIPICATNDCHYLRKEDSKNHEVLLAIQSKKKWNDPQRWRFTIDGFHLKSYMEMCQGFREIGVEMDVYKEALSLTNLISEKCVNFHEIPKKKVSLPVPEQFRGKDSDEELEKLCSLSFQGKVLAGEDKRYNERLQEELSLIKKQGFAKYFLIVYELFNWCRENGIMVGPGRGSSAGSLVCYLLGITLADPIRNNLLFARFISPGRIDWPDIDADFEDSKRGAIRKHFEKIYGGDNVAAVSTFSSIHGKGAVRDISRVFDVPLPDVNSVCSVITTKLKGEEGSDHTIQEVLENFEEGKRFYTNYPEVADIAVKMEGTIRNKGQHAAAIIVSDISLKEDNRCAFVRGKEDEAVVNWDKEDIEYVGLMKLDVLGLNLLTVLNETKKMVKGKKGVEIDYESISFDDKKCFQEFSKGNNTGCFQVGSSGLKQFCRKLGIDDFEMLVHATALFRPGTLRSGLTNIFVERKHGREFVPSQSPSIDKITEKTFGVVVYQEQVMQIVNQVAGLDWEVADKIRKIIAKSQGGSKFAEYEEQFVEGCLRVGELGEDAARTMWKNFSSFGSYLFNKSHALSYSILTYWCMWLKIYYPLEFICCLLTYGSDVEEKKNEYIEEAFRLGLDLRPPKLGKSDSFLWVIEEGIMYAPFIAIKGVGEKIAKKIERIISDFGLSSEEKLPIHILKKLEEIDAYTDTPLTEKEAEKIQPHFGFTFVKDKFFRYKNLISLMKTQNSFSTLKQLDLHETDRENKVYCIEITELNLLTGKDNSIFVSATVKDNTGTCKVQISEHLYKKRKTEIEYCEGRLALCYMNSPKKAGKLICNDIYFLDDIIGGEIDGLFPEGLFRKKGIMVLQDKPFSRTDNELLSQFLPRGIRNEITFCYAPIDLIKEREEEFEKILKSESPYAVLSLGKDCLENLTGRGDKIIDKNGIIEWNEKYKTWFCWSIKPGSIYHDESQRSVFETAMKSFLNFIEKGMNRI